MKILKPIPFKEDQLISTNAVNSELAWSNATTYADGDVITYLGKRWESLQNSNTGHLPGSSPTWWLDLGADNIHAMFDTQVNTQTVANTSLAVTVKPGMTVNSLALLEVEGNTVDVVMTSGGNVVYSRSETLDDTQILDWYMYFFEPFSSKSEIVITDLPAYLNAEITVTLNSTSQSKVGSMLYGTTYSLGLTQYGASSGIRDYSVKQTDEFGRTTFVQRAYSKRMEITVDMPNTSLVFNQKLLTELRAVPCVWIGSEDSMYSNLTIFGYYRDFTIDISYPQHSLCRVEIEGLI